MESIVNYLKTGGVFMIPILVCAVWAFTVLVERAIFYAHSTFRFRGQERKVFSLLAKGDLAGVENFLNRQKGLLKNVFSVAIANRHLAPARVEEKMEAVLLVDLPPYHRFLDVLAALGGVLPLLGLLGTVTGMISTFGVIASEGGGNIQAMAEGIFVALTTTQAGLVAAVPVLLGHTILSNRLRGITDTTRKSCALLLDYLKDHHAESSV